MSNIQKDENEKSHEDHQPVLLEESIEALHIKADGRYIDLTFGGGGHARAILSKLGPKGQLLGMDRDVVAVEYAHAIHDTRLSFVHTSFDHVVEVMHERDWALESVDGVLIDLGVSSMQIDDSKRGFSFTQGGCLDMRMDTREPLTARHWINHAEVSEMIDVFQQNGEERHALKIARAIAHAREKVPIVSTDALVKIITSCTPYTKHKHPATRVFQAIRIYVNNELALLEQTLPQVPQVLKKGGRMLVISFHSLEDRIVKQFIHSAKNKKDQLIASLPRGIPMPQSMLEHTVTHTLKPVGGVIFPSTQEKKINPRSRSARMRIAQKY